MELGTPSLKRPLWNLIPRPEETTVALGPPFPKETTVELDPPLRWDHCGTWSPLPEETTVELDPPLPQETTVEFGIPFPVETTVAPDQIAILGDAAMRHIYDLTAS